MPKVGKKTYPYTKAGKKQATRDAKKRGIKVTRKPAKRSSYSAQ